MKQILFFFLGTLLLFMHCKKPQYPKVDIKEITFWGTSAIFGGIITSDGSEKIIEKGVYYSLHQKFSYETSKKITIANEFFFTKVENLLADTTYYVWAYAINSEGESKKDSVKSFKTNSDICGNETITDVEGNVYHTVKIGKKCWLKENIRTTKKRDGTSLSTSSINDSVAYYTDGRSAYHIEDPLKDKLGLLYSWKAADSVCPYGWALPDYNDWKELLEYLDQSKSGKLLKSKIGWSKYQGIEGLDFFGFSALPAGYASGNAVYSVGNNAFFWTRSPNQKAATYILMQHQKNDAMLLSRYIGYAKSVRCIKILTK